MTSQMSPFDCKYHYSRYINTFNPPFQHLSRVPSSFRQPPKCDARTFLFILPAPWEWRARRTQRLPQMAVQAQGSIFVAKVWFERDSVRCKHPVPESTLEPRLSMIQQAGEETSRGLPRRNSVKKTKSLGGGYLRTSIQILCLINQALY